MYDIKGYCSARTVKEAVSMLRGEPGAKPIAGGTDILVAIREGKLAGCSLVDIRSIPELKGISLDGESLRIGPLTTFSQLAEDPLICERAPILAEAALTIGGPQLRNSATIGGNIANGATSADMAPPLLGLDAKLTIEGPDGVRRVPLVEFYISAGRTVLNTDELITGITISRADLDQLRGRYIKYAQRNAMDIATLGCACLCGLSPDKSALAKIRLAFAVAGPTPMRARETEDRLTGLPVAEALNTVGELVCGEISPRSSWRASREFRLQIAGEISRRALETAITAAGGMP